MKKLVKFWLASIARRTFYFSCDPFPTVISNDCFGAEIYRAMNLPYNTPFVGLMLMAPCYIRMLERLEYYLSKELTFVETSRYDSINKLRVIAGEFPIATLGGDVEIQFLHYDSISIAREKWDKRKKRIDFSNLFLKFDYSKDYANPFLLEKFLSLNYKRKLAIGESFNKQIEYNGSSVSLPNYVKDGAIVFRKSLRHIDFKKLFVCGKVEKVPTLKGLFLSKYLNNQWIPDHSGNS